MDLCLSGEFLTQRARIAGERQSGLEVDHPVLHKLRDLRIEVLHSLRFSAFNRVELAVVLTLALLNTLAGVQGGFHDLEGSHPAAAIRFRHEPLADDVAE